jgi:hypothetical protein
MAKRTRWFGVAALTLAAASFLPAQHPSELTARDKSQVFIQHLVKVLKLDPAAYQALVLEYEIGSALAEAALAEGKSAELADFARELLAADFIQNALADLYPEYRRARELAEAGKDAEAGEALRPLLAHGDPYVAGYASLLRAELDFRAGRFEEVIQRCERLAAESRLRLIPDYRACELIALSFEKAEKPLLEFAQYAILVTDYQDLPPEVEKRVKSRLALLGEEIGKPLQLVAGWMNHVEKLLRQEMTRDDPTQRQGREIVTALDKLIELEEAIERNSCSSCGGDCKGGACKNGRPQGNRSNSPARVSALPPPGKGVISLHGVSRGNADSIWGQLKARDAARAMQGFRGKLPARYEQLLEQYYKALSQEP